MILSTPKQALRILAALAPLCLPTQLLAQSWQWAVAPAFVGAGSATIAATALDGAGNVVVAGSFAGTLTLGATTLTSTGAQDVFVARLSPAGAWTQAVRAGGDGLSVARALSIDAAGTAVVGGDFTGRTSTFGSFALANAGTGASSDAFVARLSSAGIWTQAVRAGGADNETLNALAVDGAGNVAAGGQFFSPTASFGPFALANQSSRTLPDLFVARLSPAGVWTQAVGVGDTGSEVVTALALAADGTAHVTGHFASNNVRFGTFTLPNTGAALASSGTFDSFFVASLSPAGAWTRALTVTSSAGVYPTGLALDAAGNLVVAGSFQGAYIRFGSPFLLNADPKANQNYGEDVFVARLSPAGAWTQAVRAGNSGHERVTQLVLDGQGNAWISGLFTGATTSFGTTQFTNMSAPVSPNTNGTADAFVARLSSAGAWTYAVQAGGPGNDQANGLVLDGAGTAAFVAGAFSSPATFGPVTLTSPATGSAFVARLAGVALAARQAVGEQVGLAPNPATTRVTLTLAAAPQARTVQVLDALGREAYRQAVPAHATAATLAVGALAPGCYVVRCGSATGRLLVE